MRAGRDSETAVKGRAGRRLPEDMEGRAFQREMITLMRVQRCEWGRSGLGKEEVWFYQRTC